MDSHQKVTETAILDMSHKVSSVLPWVVLVGSMFSQFSAAVADTVGCGGIVTEYTRHISRNVVYPLIIFCSVIFIWFTNIFEIITIASRMFAAYYFIQCLEAVYANHTYKFKGKYWSLYFVSLGFLMLFVLIFGISAE